MNRRKNWKEFKAFKLLLALGLLISHLVIIAPVLAADTTKGPAQVLSVSVTNMLSPSATVFNKLDPKNVEVTLTTGTDLSALKITNGKYVLTGNDYTLLNHKVTISSIYLDSLTTRSAKLKFDFNGGTDKYLTITLKNEPATISAKSVSFTNKSAKDVPVTVKANGLTLKGILYDGVNLPEDAYYEGTPSSSGSVKVSVRASYLATLANDTTKKLVFDYSGSGTDPSIILKVTGSKVVTISSVRTVTQTTTVSVAPVLPKQVTANYSDSSSKLVDVTWETIDPSKYAEAGIFCVEGIIAGTTVKANAIVTVVSTDPEETDFEVIDVF